MFNKLWPDIVSVIPGWSERPFVDIPQMIGFLFSAYNFFIFLYKDYRTIAHFFSWEMDKNVASNILKTLTEMSRECHNHKWQPATDTKRKKKQKKKTWCICFFSLEDWLDTLNILANTESKAYYETYTLFSL